MYKIVYRYNYISKHSSQPSFCESLLAIHTCQNRPNVVAVARNSVVVEVPMALVTIPASQNDV